MIWRSSVACLISALAVTFVVASAAGWLGEEGVYHNWGEPLSAEEAQKELQGVWAETPAETPGESDRFSAWIITLDKLSWYNFVTFDGKISDVTESKYAISFEPNSVPHRLKLTPIDAPQEGVLCCVYTIDGDILKLWTAVRNYPQPSTRTPPQVRMTRNKLPE